MAERIQDLLMFAACLALGALVGVPLYFVFGAPAFFIGTVVTFIGMGITYG